MSSSAARVQKWIWILIYLGMIALALGLSVQRSNAALGWGIIVPGIGAIVGGVVLIWVRSRMKNTRDDITKETA